MKVQPMPTDRPLFGDADMRELQRIAEVERIREAARRRTARERLEQGLPATTQVEVLFP